MSADAAALELTVCYEHDGDGEPPPRRTIRAVLRAALRGPATLAVRYVSCAESRALNLRYLGKDRPANVLAFAYPGTGPPAGDVAICPAVVEAEARELGTTGAARHAHMLVHAALHLQGMAHDTERAAAQMEGAERRILARLGLPDPYLA